MPFFIPLNLKTASFGFYVAKLAASFTLLLQAYQIMSEQESYHYHRIAQAIEFIQTNFKNQPNLEAIAEHVHLSPFHFQRLFSEWAGVSPKQFLRYTSLQYAKSLLKKPQATLFDTAYEVGLSSTGRLHDLFMKIEGMTPKEYKNGGQDLVIEYNLAQTPFGKVIVANTQKGICYLAFAEEEGNFAFERLKKLFPQATFQDKSNSTQQSALALFYQNWEELPQIKLHMKGTEFQLKIWEALLTIPLGKLSTYGEIANQIDSPKASRAVGTAIGSNPIAYLIPCHRVIQASGNIGGYMWGTTRKSAIIGWEAAKVNR